MADDWEEWEDDNFQVPGITNQLANTSIEKKFEDEDAAVEEEDVDAEVEKPKPKAKTNVKKVYQDKAAAPADDMPLDDPVAEKLRQQRLVEESDFRAAQELFGVDRSLDSFIPKSQKDFEEYARMLVHNYVLPHADSSHYKTLVKGINRVALTPMTAQETKDVETSVAGIRSDKLKQERDAVKDKKTTGKKKDINLGRGGTGKGFDNIGNAEEYLDDGALDNDDNDDGYDFM